jgi:hypothetical protein
MVAGEAVCKWSEMSGRRPLIYQGEEKYINSVSYLFGSKDGESLEVPVGLHTYNFVCQLQNAIPYSVEGKYGWIRYKVDVNLDIPWALDLIAEKPFTVLRQEDLNIFPELRLPCQFEEIKIFCCLFCKSEPLIMKVRLPRTGFALGEKIPVNIELINKSSTDIAATTLTLKRIDVFNSEIPFEKTKTTKEEIVEKRAIGAKRGDTVQFDETIEVPAVLRISNNRYCKVFQITYELIFGCETSGLSVGPEITIPITLGSIGLQSTGYQLPKHDNQISSKLY